MNTFFLNFGARMTEASTYAGFAAILSALGLALGQATQLHGPAMWVALAGALASGVAAMARAEGSTKVAVIADELSTVAVAVKAALPVEVAAATVIATEAK